MDTPVFDLHCDAVLKLVHRNARFRNDNPVSHVDIPKMKRGNVNGIIYSLWSDPIFKESDAVKRTQYMLDRCRTEIEECRDLIHLSENAGDLTDSVKQGKITAILGIEGGQSINNDLKVLEDFRRQGVRRMTLVHTASTDWAGSATDEGKTRGLSSFGHDVVHLMNDLGMIVDVAHASEKTFLDVTKVSKKPVFCTHSLARSVFDSERLATDDMICAIGESGGIFGLAFFPAFFPNQNREATRLWMENIIKKLNESGQGSTPEEKAHNNAAVFMDTPPPGEVAALDGLFPHIDHVISLIGEDHVGIGTDFDGMPYGPVGLEDAGKFDNLRVAMKKHGYSETRIHKILGGNVRRVLTEILPAR
ncbi:MAG: dipeptidase [Bdellovibrionota bacterium]